MSSTMPTFILLEGIPSLTPVFGVMLCTCAALLTENLVMPCTCAALLTGFLVMLCTCAALLTGFAGFAVMPSTCAALLTGLALSTCAALLTGFLVMLCTCAALLTGFAGFAVMPSTCAALLTGFQITLVMLSTGATLLTLLLAIIIEAGTKCAESPSKLECKSQFCNWDHLLNECQRCSSFNLSKLGTLQVVLQELDELICHTLVHVTIDPKLCACK